MTLPQRGLKRSLDVAASLAGLLVLLVPGALIALVIRLSSPGPAFFVQTRMGRHGRPFRCVKFRTMRLGADAGGPVTAAGDARVTPVPCPMSPHGPSGGVPIRPCAQTASPVDCASPRLPWRQRPVGSRAQERQYRDDGCATVWSQRRKGSPP
ncbi:MAG: sugar transferase [Candidatus Rokubacteria bacterium]|nr:sugar transferase [Candidatus Rokubacteria bacterium]